MKRNDISKLKLTAEQYSTITNKVFSDIAASLVRGEKVKIRRFGTLQITEYKARNGRNPKTGQQIKIPAKKVIKLNVSKQLKNEVNNYYSEG